MSKRVSHSPGLWDILTLAASLLTGQLKHGLNKKVSSSPVQSRERRTTTCVYVVRKYLGYTRYDVPEIVPIMNELYHGITSCRSDGRLRKYYKRTYEKIAMTPYKRVMEHADISEETKQCLQAEHETLKLHLKRKIDID